MIIFARTRHRYDSYTDFWALVELAGFETCYVDEAILISRNVYITTMHSAEWEAMIASRPVYRKAHLILWNIERPRGWTQTVGRYNDRCHGFLGKRWYDEIWVSDRRLAAETELRFVILGSHPLLGSPGEIEDKRYDFCHMSALTNRRQSIYKQFPQETIGPNCWGVERHGVLQQSKFALNIHQDDHPYQEPLRFALFAAYGLPILSEVIFDSYPWYDYMVYDKYPHLVGHMLAMLGNQYEKWYTFGLRARQRMTVEFEFGKMVREAVYQTTGIK